MDISQLEYGQHISDWRFLLEDVAAKRTQSGKPYLAGTLRDETGRIEMRKWDEYDHPPAGEVVEVDGTVDRYKGELQIEVAALRIARDADPAEYVESAHRPVDALWDTLLDLLGEECRPDRTDLLKTVTHVAKRAIDAGLHEAPAAKSNHHARFGGLVEHIHSMAFLAVQAEVHYSRRHEYELDLAVLLAGIVLHDIGKVAEMTGPIGTEYTRSGRLEGHISIAVRWLEEAADAVGLDDETCGHLRHLILSHHGKQEWGSPVEPRTPEAVVLHQLDMLDSRTDAVLDAASKADGGEAEVNRKTMYLRREGSDE